MPEPFPIGRSAPPAAFAMVDPLRALLAPRAGDRVLEIGAGLGSLTLALRETGADVTAVEVDRHLVPLLRENVEPLGVRVRYAPLSPGALDGLRAVGGTVTRAGPAPTRGARRLAALAKALDDSPEGRAVWRKLVVLENPAP